MIPLSLAAIAHLKIFVSAFIVLSKKVFKIVV